MARKFHFPLARIVTACFLPACAAPALAQEPRPWISLPTENRAVFEGRPEKFYMYVERTFEGEKSKPLEGGMYGFTRNPRRDGGRIYFTRFHEGIDIAPVRRDGRGEPLDPVLAAAEGVVAFVSDNPSTSNYGRYLVIEHRIGGAEFHTLYAHLASIVVREGQKVRQGQPLGRLGYSGAGINRERAHLHFEVCLMVNRGFDAWYATHFKEQPNRHGIFHGWNLLGMDPLGLIKAVRANPLSTPADFLGASRPLFQITVNNSDNLHLLRRNPWLVRKGEIANPPAWTITFSEHIVPMRAEARTMRVPEPDVRWLGDDDIPLSVRSRGMITGSPSAPQLTDTGKRFAHLLTFPDN